MANQSPDRREVLNMLARVAAIAPFGGFSQWVCAGQPDQPERTAAYKPIFFTPDEYQVVDHLTARIIPADETPGAREAGVAEFVDFITAHDVDLQPRFRTGLAWLHQFAIQNGGMPFQTLSSAAQDKLLRRLAYRSDQNPSEKEGQEFFRLIRKYTVIGFYTSRIGLETLDYPGLRVYSSSPECPHHDDPEHRHLGQS